MGKTAKKIHIDVCRIHKIFVPAATDSRTEQIQQLKQAIYRYRNQLLSKYLAQNIQNSDIQRNVHGKPFLMTFPQLQFNHSHSRQHYALASSFELSDVGIDIEDLDRKVRFDALAQHAFHPNELKYWQDLEHDADYWFRVWTTKEAVLKASGLGIRLSLNELDTRMHPSAQGGLCHHPQIGHFAYQNFRLPDCMLTVAWRAAPSCAGFQFPQIDIIRH
ncbi:ACP synthase [Acinetobacter sp. KAM398]|uniref:4'-phosphopantetheinyl transferase family protein n=1 Tax=Acinetobacter TaxID=469 RepID=UPI00035D4BD4|nr:MULTISPECIES: 4'-phosphopantetheinyl transferase superfamily protein [unclassified Acinetobacter]MCD0188811.1 4'-phosphopantetheinyl transferase superfamily protein [Acinetobacter sp. PW68]GJC30961.1 ACP synthase [Acinetobacter sp. KAM392]GJC33770.1 ACP synthase [Acinetobacter sp. KAM393]GJC36599.1 ACP synthase [Acinetobacter sp. KAM394]GJC39499.1 ACP synthase [Acinetobacter sp. KAM395]